MDTFKKLTLIEKRNMAIEELVNFARVHSE
jgi:hypothetical protein